MTEQLLQFIWQFQYFQKSGLATVTGEPLEILVPGRLNHNQGPDFLDAKIRIGDTTWAGTVELHLQTADWDKHRHGSDKNYRNVVLHVVWEDTLTKNISPATSPPSPAPVLELRNRVSKLMLRRYEDLMHAASFIPCEKMIQAVPDLNWKSWKDRLLAERLSRKAALAGSYLQQNNFHWEETFWWMLARNFGNKVNADAFEAVARSLPLTLLAHQKKELLHLEALLQGQAGLLEAAFTDEYPRLLQQEYAHLRHKYRLQPIAIPVHFLRMRPVNFPGLRLAQLAVLVRDAAHLFSRIREAVELKTVRSWFDLSAGGYWQDHYRFDEPSVSVEKKLGHVMTDTIIINCIAPVLFAWGHYYGENAMKEKAVRWLEQTGAEVNAVTKEFRSIGVEQKNAFDSQALLELKSAWCDQRRCLDCAIGNYLLKQNS